MLVKRDFRFPEIFLGAMLAVAIFAMGMLFESRSPPPAAQHQHSTNENGAPQSAEHSPDKLTDWLLVLLNGFLVGSTILLWRANNRSALIAEHALTRLEPPFIGLSIIDTGLGYTDQHGDWIVEEVRSQMEFCFANHGRSAAVLLKLMDKLEICKNGELPTLQWNDDRVKPYPYGVLIGPDKSSAKSVGDFAKFVDRDEMLTFTHGNHDLFLAGRLTYRDLFENSFEMGFCAVFNRETDGFLMKGDDEYNYCRRVT